jgi:hypothetical protein
MSIALTLSSNQGLSLPAIATAKTVSHILRSPALEFVGHMLAVLSIVMALMVWVLALVSL